MTRLVLFELFVTNLSPTKNCSLADSFLDPVTKYGSG